jgi:hypothetical protein
MKIRLAICVVTVLAAIFIAESARAEAIAKTPNNGGGFIVLTNEPCIYKGKDYSPLKRAYSYTARGYTFEGCFGIEDETVITVWQDGNEQRRYPVSNFELIRKGQAI